MKTDFELPTDVKNDLVYCQRALTSHILIHQVNYCIYFTRIVIPVVFLLHAKYFDEFSCKFQEVHCQWNFLIFEHSESASVLIEPYFCDVFFLAVTRLNR